MLNEIFELLEKDIVCVVIAQDYGIVFESKDSWHEFELGINEKSLLNDKLMEKEYKAFPLNDDMSTILYSVNLPVNFTEFI